MSPGILVSLVGAAVASPPTAEARARAVVAECAPDVPLAGVSCTGDRCVVMFREAGEDLRRKISSCPAWREAYGESVDSATGYRECPEREPYLTMWPTGPFPGDAAAEAFPCAPPQATAVPPSPPSPVGIDPVPTEWVTFREPSLPFGAGDRFLRRRKLGRTGALVLAASVPIGVAGFVGLAICPTPACQALAVGASIGGSALYLAGGSTMFAGAIGASSAAGLSPGVGIAGLSLWISSVIFALPAPPVALLTQIGGLALGAAELARAGQAGRDQGWVVHLVPRPDGLSLVARF